MDTQSRKDTLGKASEEQFRTLLESMNDLVFTLDCKQRHTGIFGRCLAKCKLAPESFLGRTAREVFGAEDACAHETANERALAGEHVMYEWSAQCPHGTLRFQTSLSPLQDSTGAIVGIVGVGRDITEQKRAEQKLRESEEKYRMVVENMNEVVYMVSLDGDPFGGTVRLVGGRVESIIGYQPQEFLRDPGLWFRILHPDDVPGAIEATEKILAGKEASAREYRIRHKKTGRYRWVEDKVVPRFDDQGKVVGIFGVARDITERKHAEDTLLAHQERLRSLASELSFAEERERRRIAAELHDRVGQNLILSKIKLAAVRSTVASEDLRRPLDEIAGLMEEAIRDTRTLIFELSPPILYVYGLEPAVEWLAEQVQDKCGIRIEVEDDKQPKPLEEDVRVLLFQATRELLMNVVKHSQARRAQISIRRDGCSIRITVEDDGIGFDDFKSDLHIDNVAGFGLFSIRERLTRIGGSFEIKSALGQGACLTLKAPLKVQT
jgi:PAS domain S-box-containing protein